MPPGPTGADTPLTVRDAPADKPTRDGLALRGIASSGGVAPASVDEQDGRM